MSIVEGELLQLSQKLLNSIDQQNWYEYSRLVDASLSSFEPEGRGHLIQGIDFHRFYFENLPSMGETKSTISSPNVRVMGDVAIVTYVRLVQKACEGRVEQTGVSEETRVWKKMEGEWRNVHFHRSKPGE